MTNHLYDTLFAARETSEKTFLIDGDGEMSYRAFLERVNQLANALIKSGLQTGDRVAVQAQKSKAQ
ncbi:MAG: malonyl-CoA synthase, partial [Proteobacteria bacterium]|nr:malonyl-CoA synthase [Pseudomonadota bacterium]